MKLKAIIAAGGTGGHFFPALAVAEEMKSKLNGEFSAVFIGTESKIEARKAPEFGYGFMPIPISGYMGLKSLSTYLLPFKILKSIAILDSYIKREKPDFALCAGAYISYPLGIAAVKNNLPLFLMESNVNPGKAIKVLRKKATAIISTFEETKNYFEPELRSKIFNLGNPVRADFGETIDKAKACAEFGFNPEKPVILIFGGSLGARAINMETSHIINKLSELGYQIIWQTGAKFVAPKNLPSNIKVLEFINDMPSAYSASDLVVSRSGATTVAELCVVGKPSILIPLPSASNNEQFHNAKILKNKGAAEIILNDELADNLYGMIKLLMDSPEKLQSMGLNVKSLAKPNAARDAVELILKTLNK